MDEGNLAMTYSALATLITLEDDLADVDGQAIVRALGSLQQEDGRLGNREGTMRGNITRMVVLAFHSSLNLPAALRVQARLTISTQRYHLNPM